MWKIDSITPMAQPRFFIEASPLLANQTPSRTDDDLATSKVAETQAVRLVITGRWVVTEIPALLAKLKTVIKPHSAIRLETTDLEALDSAGGLFLRRVLEGRLIEPPFKDQPEFALIFAKSGAAYQELEAYQRQSSLWYVVFIWPILAVLDRLGRATIDFLKHFVEQMEFMGRTIIVSIRALFGGSGVRWAPLFNMIQRAGLEAIPIVILSNLFIGAVVAFLGVLTLQELGGGIYAVEMIGMAVFREFAPVIAATFMAGRSASAFAAEIGTMKMRQEIDAMRVMGIDPFDALVVPRFFAMIIMLPLVTFVAAIAGLFGGALVVWALLDYGLPFFAERILDYVPVENLVVGMVKTPFFGATIALIGCRMGMMVDNDVVSLGKRVTTAVVHSIFMIFMLNAFFAIILRELKL